MDEQVLSLHEDLLDLLQIALSGERIDNIFAFQKKVTESLGFSGFSCILWDEKSELPKVIFDGLKVKLNENLLSKFVTTIIESINEDVVPLACNERDYVLIPILRLSKLIAFYVLAIKSNGDLKLIPPKSFLKSMRSVGLQIHSRFLSGDTDKLDWFFRLGVHSHCLNSKQKQVLELLFKGETNKSIGEVVHLSEQAVKYHVSCLLDKFEVKTRYQLKDKVLELSRSLRGA